ncbi:hypothetical protein F2Q69_00003266 [Brassica cretica]|uniref:Replication protein A 70 kDa DNA-binding subunit B/D first OB fold domain-containing protein n=1 Tax=Brassica cretica TaxID=69181 RepID=A0A8S9PBG4_BRACR|nr:hypothetical protein F2Q69_00003266 [Brassica cretica]
MASKALNNTANDSTEQITAISDLKPKHTTKKVHVKVLHSWTQNINQGGKTIEFVLADENGHKIHASCKKIYFESKGRLLLVGVWRNIKNFQVRPAGGAYRTTNHIYKISFNQATVVSRSNFMNDDLYLNLVDFQSVLSGTLDEKLLIDVLGQVLDCGAVETIQCAGGNQRKKLEFTLRDIKDTGDDKTLKPYESNEESQEYINKQIDQADKRGQHDKWFWLHLMVKDDTGVSKIMILDKVANGIVAESPLKLLNVSWDELEDTSLIPDAITDLIGKNFTFGVYVEKDNVSYVQSETPLTITSVDEVKLSNLSQELKESVSTPSSKRKEDEAISLPDISSTSKKPCLMTVKVEKAEETG